MYVKAKIRKLKKKYLKSTIVKERKKANMRKSKKRRKGQPEESVIASSPDNHN